MKRVRLWVTGTVIVGILGMVAVSAVDKGRADDNKALTAAIVKLADSIGKNSPDAKKQAEEIAKKNAELDVVMELFKKRDKGGIGVGDKPGAIKPDGIEAKLQGLEKPMAAKQLETEAASLEKSGYIVSAIALTIVDMVPKEKKKNAKEWQTFSEELRKSSLELANAAKAKNPADLQKAAKAVNNACTKCHSDFRD